MCHKKRPLRMAKSTDAAWILHKTREHNKSGTEQWSQIVNKGVFFFACIAICHACLHLHCSIRWTLGETRNDMKYFLTTDEYIIILRIHTKIIEAATKRTHTMLPSNMRLNRSDVDWWGICVSRMQSHRGPYVQQRRRQLCHRSISLLASREWHDSPRTVENSI